MNNAIGGTGDGAVASRIRPVYRVQPTTENKKKRAKRSRTVVQTPTVIYLNGSIQSWPPSVIHKARRVLRPLAICADFVMNSTTFARISPVTRGIPLGYSTNLSCECTDLSSPSSTKLSWE